jgi:hypothetical protein
MLVWAYLQSPASESSSLPQGELIILITTVAGIITTIIGFVVQLYRERRNRAWELEDRRLTAEALQQKNEQTAATLQKETQRTRDMLARKIDENTKISADAFSEANAVNVKLARIDALIDGVRTQAQLEHVAEIVTDTKLVAEATKEDTGFIKEKLDHG